MNRTAVIRNTKSLGAFDKIFNATSFVKSIDGSVKKRFKIYVTAKIGIYVSLQNTDVNLYIAQ